MYYVTQFESETNADHATTVSRDREEQEPGSVLRRHFVPVVVMGHDARLRQPGQYGITIVDSTDHESLDQTGGCLFAENASHRFSDVEGENNIHR